jgi:alginate O-acetyltransferase complex protein AlgJ
MACWRNLQSVYLLPFLSTVKTAANAPHSIHWPDRVLISLFAVFLLLPLLDLAFHIDLTSVQSENRLLAPWPPPPKNRVELRAYCSKWEGYFNDHFGCRRVLIMWHNKLKWAVFRDKNAKNVLIGTDGWMFTSNNQMIEYFRGALPFTDKELNDWQKLLEHRRDWLARRGITYLFVIAPDKQSVYTEYLPAWLKDLGGQTRVDQFFAHMKTHSTMAVLDLRPTLLAAKESAPTYQKTDTHWNQFGAFMACAELVRVLAQQQAPGLAPLALDSFDQTNRHTFGGDLVNARGISINMAESNAVFFTPKPALPALETFEPAGQLLKDMAFSKLPGKRGRAIVYHDSFGRYWVPFLGYQFGEVDYFWQYDLDPKIIEQQKPVVVVNEMLDRFFNVTDPRQLSAKEALP